jgi:hypothetical protein
VRQGRDDDDDPVAAAYILAWLYRQHPDSFLALTLDELADHVVETEKLFGKLKSLPQS